MAQQIDTKKLREVAGAFATGITVVTTKKEDGDIHGMTANSFVSLSLHPPLVAFSVRKEGKMAQHLNVEKAVGISILSDQQEAISQQFAGKPNDSLEVEMEVHTNGSHTIKNSLAWYTTIIKDIIEVGDHDMIICQVESLGRTKGNPLLYYSGYRTLES